MRGPNRRQVLAAIVLAPIVSGGIGATAGCGLFEDGAPDPLVPLAAQARADAALADAVAADVAAGASTAQVREIVAARTAHADALDAEITRRSGGAAPAAPAAPPAGAVTLVALRTALTGAGQDAARVVLDLPADRVGLVASVAACCSAHAAVLA
ncbi:hypothetical protein [Pseudonocardia sp.]|uniref:hypothetical protein n=1 Tax=Pseudonocardia sp. TaxID=60912 RepID=UPI003D10C2A7